jgi:hypothetical protein
LILLFAFIILSIPRLCIHFFAYGSQGGSMAFGFRRNPPEGEAVLVKVPNPRRKKTTIAAAVIYFAIIVFLVLVEVGSTHIRPVLTDIYFFRLVLANIIPLSVNNAQLLNTIARSLGLHDFYQIGLWNFCEGYQNEYGRAQTQIIGWS